MKIVFMGTPEFAVNALEAIIKAGHEVTAVVTQPDKPKGRSRQMQITPVKECAERYEIPVLQPIKLREPASVKELRSYPADIYVVAAFGQILTEEVLSIPKFGSVCIHASFLPAYRGAAPIQRVIMDGMKSTGITIMQMDKGIDTGDIISQEKIDILDSDTGGSLNDKLAVLGAKMITDILPKIETGTAVRTKQDDTKSNYASMLSKSEGLIDWNDGAEKIERTIRALDPWPSAYTFYNGKMMKIWKAKVQSSEADGDLIPEADEASGKRLAAGKNAGLGRNDVREAAAENDKMQNGMIADVTKDSFSVKTGSGNLCVTEIQLEGKKRMTVHDFLLGIKLDAGEKLESGR